MQPNLTACIDCGAVGERLLADRFPHICGACLFPPQKPSEDPTASAPDFLPVVGLIEKLRSLPATAAWASGSEGWKYVGRKADD